MKISIDSKMKNIMPNCRLGYIVIRDAIVRGAPPALTQEFLQLQSEVAKIYNLDVLYQAPRILAVRTMYKKMDFDPSRYHPASEALVRRVIQNRGLHYVNSAVDASNYCSIKFLMPFGLYDMDKIKGDIIYQKAVEGSYVSISGETASTEGKPFLTDDEGVFGNPTADAIRTAVTLNTKNLLSVIYADEEVGEKALEEALAFTADFIVRHNGGIITETSVVFA